MKHLRHILLFILLVSIGCEPSSTRILRQAEYRYRQGDTEQIEQIAAFLYRDDESSIDAAYTLGRIGDPRATRHLVEVIEHRRYALREAIRALGMLKDPRAVPVLIQVVKNDYREAEDAINVLGSMKDKRAIPILMQVVEERRPYFVKAIEALGEIGDTSAINLLVDALRHPPVDESRNIQFRIINEDPSKAEEKEHMLTFRVPENLPPKITILAERIETEGYIFFSDRLQDTEYDSLALKAEFSVNNGRNWHTASTEGRLEDISERLYQGRLIWRADLDNIPLLPQTRLVFKLTPLDFIPRMREGIPEISRFDIDSTAIDFKDIDYEVSGDVPMKFFYPNPARAYIDSFAFHFSTDRGITWLPATVQLGLAAAEAEQDSIGLIWASAVDLPNRDEDEVLFRISENKIKTLGRHTITDPIHVDNNTVPVAEFQDFNESNIFEIGYVLQDVEQDTVSLSVFYSTDQGRSWKPTTLSGDFSQLTPDRYTGTLRWFADFDVTADRSNTIRLRIRPEDRDPGQFTDSRDFYLKDLDFSKMTQGISSGFIELMYPAVGADSLQPRGEFSTDGGRTWRPATLADVQAVPMGDKTTLRINWDFPHDVSRNLMQIEAIGQSLEKMKDSSIVPDLLYIARQFDSPSRVRRQQAIEVNRLLDKKSDWITEGLIASLVHPDRSIQLQAYDILQKIDTPDIRMALVDYEKYWSDLRRKEREMQYFTSEQDQQRYLKTISEVPPPTEGQIVDFLMGRGMTRTKSERFLRQLDIIKRKQQLKADYESGAISYDDYMLKLSEIVAEARAAREREMAEERKKLLKEKK